MRRCPPAHGPFAHQKQQLADTLATLPAVAARLSTKYCKCLPVDGNCTGYSGTLYRYATSLSCYDAAIQGYTNPIRFYRS